MAVNVAMSVQRGNRGVLEGAFGLLSSLRQIEEAGLTRLARDSGLPKGTAHRLLDQLVGLGMVSRSSGRYRLGPQAFLLGHRWEPYPGLHAVAAEPVRALACETNTTLAVCVLAAGRVLVTAMVPGEAERILPLRAGATMSRRTAAGKLLLALSYPDSSLSREAAGIRARGIAYDREELAPGLFGAAAPLLSPPGETVAALSALTPAPALLEPLGAAVARTAAVIGARLRSAERTGSRHGRVGVPTLAAVNELE